MPLLAVVTLAKKSNIPEDAVQNSFAFATATDIATTAEMNAISTALGAFYNTAVGAGAAINTWLSAALSTVANAGSIEFFDLFGHLDGSSHGAPIRVDPFTLTATGAGGALPNECALVCTVKSTYGLDPEFGVGGTRPRARDRGRLYLGPLDTDVMVQDATTKEMFVSPTALAHVTASAAALMNNVGVDWCVWSRASAALKTITSGWVDNALDVQRRRGQVATTRVAF